MGAKPKPRAEAYRTERDHQSHVARESRQSFKGQTGFNANKREVLKESTVTKLQIEKKGYKDVKGLATIIKLLENIDIVKTLMDVSKDLNVEHRWKPTQDLRADVGSRLKPGESLHVNVGGQDSSGKFESIRITPTGQPRLEERKSTTPTDIIEKTMADAAGTAPHRGDPPTEFIVERPARDGFVCTLDNLDGGPRAFSRSDSEYRAMENELMTRHGSVRATEPPSDQN